MCSKEEGSHEQGLCWAEHVIGRIHRRCIRRSFEYLFKWLREGDVAVPTAVRQDAAHVACEDRHMKDQISNTGALVVGRRLFDMAGGWMGLIRSGSPSWS